MTKLSKAFAIVGIVCSQFALAANDFPNRPISYIAHFPPGGATDNAARILAEELSKELKQTIVVENRSGASGSIGVNQIIRSKADGYTIGSLAAPSLTAPFILLGIKYNLTKDIKPIGQIYITPIALVVNPKTHHNIKNINDLIELAKSHKEGILYTTASAGSTAHLSMESIRKNLGIPMVHVPFKGSAPGVTALLAGEVTFMYSDLAAVLGQIKAKTLRALVINTDQRLDILPDVPTLKEENIPTSKAASWGGLIAPKDTPDDIIEKYSTALKKALDNEQVQQKLKNAGLYPHYSTPKEFGKTIAHDSQIWEQVVKENYSSNQK